MFYEERSAWISRQRRVANFPGLEEMSYFLFGRSDIDDVIAEVEPVLKSRGTALDVLDVAETSSLAISSELERQSWLVWNITDGGGPFSGSHVPSFARLLGIRRFGNSSYNQFLSQDKFKCGLFCRQLGVPVPPTLLCEGRTVIAGSLEEVTGQLFVKPCALDNKIGIFPDACANDIETALMVSERIHHMYGDRALIQPFIQGKDLRVSFLNVDPTSNLLDSIGLYWSDERNESEPVYNSYRDHLAAFMAWDAASTSKAPAGATFGDGIGSDLEGALRRVSEDVRRVAGGMGLRDYFSFDFRIDDEGQHWLMELNTAPFLRNVGMRHFIRKTYALSFGAALVAAFQNSFLAGPQDRSPDLL